MKPLLVVILSTALVPLISVPAFAQAASDDQYGGSTIIGSEAAEDALQASEAFDPGPNSAAASPAVGESSNNAAAASDASDSEVDPAGGGTAEDEDGGSGDGVSAVGSSEAAAAAENEDGGSGDSVAATGSSEADAEPWADPAEVATITKLPETGGPSPLSLGVVLVVGGLLVRVVARRAVRGAWN